ncbi:hypothetical protein M5D96_005898 [Drosophila gunungcola]|uniref:Ionotropic receptor 75a N-terminal domain-containing protein n=1 Tax=Drosophila gunungcola TaxID=103775 RepID=A0A9P9YRV3_9MUSC|nr:hypothetical protein M5D96_005898 [Drosophila gunungcola]
MLNENNIYSQYIDLQQNPENLANIHKDYLDSDLVRLGVFLDMGCDQAEFITNQGANLSLNADVTYVSRQEEDVFTLYDVYNKGSHLGGKLNITIDQSLQCNQSRCQVKYYLSDLHLRTRLQHRLDLSSVTFRLAALVSVLPIDSSEEELLEFLNSERDSHMDSFSRIGYRLILHTQELLGFKLHYIWLDTWSVQDAYGGAIGMLTNESVELCTSPFVPSWNRLHYVHLMTEQAQFRAAAVFLEPFMPSVWFAFAGLLIFAGVLLWLIFLLERHWMQRCLDFIPSLLSSCLISGRLAFIAVMLTSFLMYNYYTSIVVSTLLGSPVRSNIRTIQQLADSSLDVGFDKVPFTKTYLVSSPRPDIRSLYKQKVESRRDPNSVWLSPEVGVIKVRDQPGFVYTSEASFMYHFVEKHYLPREISDLNEIKLRPESAVYGVVRMLESGIISKQSRFFSKSKLETFSNSFVIQVGMEYAAPLFISLLVAYFLVLLILILELGWARFVKKKSATILPRNQPGAKRLYGYHYHWLIYDTSMEFCKIENQFKEAQLFVDADVTYVKHDLVSKNFILYDLHNKGRQLGAKLNITQDREVTHLPLSVSRQKIFDFMESKEQLYLDTYGRLGYQARQPLRDMLDCENRWSDGNATGGMIGDLILDVADLAIAPFVYSFDRGLFLQPLTKFSVFREICMFRNPRSVSAGLSATEFLQPFSGGRRKEWKPSLMTSCLLSFGAGCNQGAWFAPRSMGGRMAFFALMLTSFLMYNYYTSIVVSKLLGQPSKSSIRTLQQLADSSLEVLGSKRSPDRIWIATEAGVKAVRDQEGFVYITGVATGYEFVRKHFLPHQICELNEIPLRDASHTHSVVAKKSPYAELFKLNELRMLETGIHLKHERYWMETKLHCYQHNHTVAVGLEYAAPLFILLLGAIIVCMGVLGLEFAQQFIKPIHPILVYHQFVQMKGVQDWSHLELSYMGHLQPTLGIYVDIKCDQALDLLEEASRAQLYNQHYHWLLHGNQSVSEFYDMFAPFNISIDADVSYVKEELQDINSSFVYAVYDVYNNGKIIGVATVVTQRPLTLSDDELIRFLSQENETHIDSLVRFGFHLTLILRDQLHCKMKFIFSDSWSKSDVVGGSVGAIVDQTADITATPSLATEGRLKYLSAIIETGFFRSVCIFRTPHNAGLRGDVFLQPFSPLVCFGAACIQSSSLIPRSAGGRLIYFALFLISFIMYNYYTSVVVSSLLSSPVKSKIKTMQQLAESPLTVGLEPLPFTKSYLNYSRLPEIQLFIKRKIETQAMNPELWLPAEQGVLRVRDNPGYVFVFETSSGYAYVERYFTAQQICDLNEVLFRPEQFLRILETGVYRKQRSYWVHMKLHCVAQNFVITVGMEYVAPLLLMLICADILVVIILLVELAWKRFLTSPTVRS